MVQVSVLAEELALLGVAEEGDAPGLVAGVYELGDEADGDPYGARLLLLLDPVTGLLGELLGLVG